MAKDKIEVISILYIYTIFTMREKTTTITIVKAYKISPN